MLPRLLLALLVLLPLAARAETTAPTTLVANAEVASLLGPLADEHFQFVGQTELSARLGLGVLAPDVNSSVSLQARVNPQLFASLGLPLYELNPWREAYGGRCLWCGIPVSLTLQDLAEWSAAGVRVGAQLRYSSPSTRGDPQGAWHHLGWVSESLQLYRSFADLVLVLSVGTGQGLSTQDGRLQNPFSNGWSADGSLLALWRHDAWTAMVSMEASSVLVGLSSMFTTYDASLQVGRTLWRSLGAHTSLTLGSYPAAAIGLDLVL